MDSGGKSCDPIHPTPPEIVSGATERAGGRCFVMEPLSNTRSGAATAQGAGGAGTAGARPVAAWIVHPHMGLCWRRAAHEAFVTFHPSRSRLSTKVLIGSAIFVLVMVALALTALGSLRNVARHVEVLVDEQLPRTQLLAQISQARAESDHAIDLIFGAESESPERRRELYDDVVLFVTVFDEGVKSCEKMIGGGSLRATWERLKPHFSAWRSAIDRQIAAARARDAAEGRAAFVIASRTIAEAQRASREASQRLDQGLLEFMRESAHQVQVAKDESRSSTRSAISLVAIAIVLGILGVILASMVVKRSVEGTVKRLVAEADRLEAGIAEGRLDVRGDPDRVGEDFRSVVAGMNATMEAFVKPIELTAEYMGRIGRGDIPPRIAEEFRGDFEALKQSVNACIDAVHARAEAQRLQTEAHEAQRMEAVGRLAGGIAQDMSQPIQQIGDSTRFLEESVIAFLKLLEKCRSSMDGQSLEAIRALELELNLDYLVEQTPKQFERALDAVDRVARTVRALNDFAQPDRKEMVATDLNRAIRATLEVTRNEYKHVADVETDLRDIPLVTCHVSDFNRVLLSVIVNAAEAIADAVRGTPRRGTICVATKRDRDHVVVTISDTGTGIPSEFREKVFDPFFTTKVAGRGAGHSLPIAKRIMSMHHGTIQFESSAEKGTTFFLRIPIAQPSSSATPFGFALD